MKFSFHKYQGAGNDFILIDHRTKNFPFRSKKIIEKLCDRKFGIGADGLILLEAISGSDFKMIYYNSDGRIASLCGNGARCITAFARKLGIVDKKANFIASDGNHFAQIMKYDAKNDAANVRVQMNKVTEIEKIKDAYFLNTGSPHFVKLVSDIEKVNVQKEGKKIRNSARFKVEGTNVDFIEKKTDGIFMRVYERGVENETLSSGTGATACALVASLSGWLGNSTSCKVYTQGGLLRVGFQKKNDSFYEVWLEGEARFVYEGSIEL